MKLDSDFSSDNDHTEQVKLPRSTTAPHLSQSRQMIPDSNMEMIQGDRYVLYIANNSGRDSYIIHRDSTDFLKQDLKKQIHQNFGYILNIKVFVVNHVDDLFVICCYVIYNDIDNHKMKLCKDTKNCVIDLLDQTKRGKFLNGMLRLFHN